MNDAELGFMKAGYLRGLLGMPLVLSDIDLAREQLIEKYREELSGGIKAK